MLTIKNNVDLSAHNTFKVKAFAKYFVSIESIQDLLELISLPVFKQPSIVLGSGSNILFTKDFDGLIIHSAIKGIQVVSETSSHVTVNVGAGEIWHEFVLHCIKHNWGGIENLSLIPGTVGAAPVQNIGAYGVEVKDVIEKVTCFHLETKKEITFNREECAFGYRDSVFKSTLSKKIFISSVTLRLTKKQHTLFTSYGTIKDMLLQRKIHAPTIRDISDCVIEIRRSKLPDVRVLGNAGSFFKNPVIDQTSFITLKQRFPKIVSYQTENQQIKISAAWLIEQCNWKGIRIRDAGVHEFQPLVIINYAHASGQEILSLAKKIKSSVAKKFGIQLTSEVNIL